MSVNLSFTDVNQVDHGVFTAIEFQLHGLHYYVHLDSFQGKWEALGIHHRLFGHGSCERCPYCNERMFMANSCNVLSKQTDAIFQQLIQYNSIRMHWLYEEIN